MEKDEKLNVMITRRAPVRLHVRMRSIVRHEIFDSNVKVLSGSISSPPWLNSSDLIVVKLVQSANELLHHNYQLYYSFLRSAAAAAAAPVVL